MIKKKSSPIKENFSEKILNLHPDDAVWIQYGITDLSGGVFLPTEMFVEKLLLPLAKMYRSLEWQIIRLIRQ